MSGARTELAVWGLTDPGKVRSENQDTFLAIELSLDSAGGWRVGPQSAPDGNGAETSSGASAVERRFTLGPEGALLLVADGMGGVAGGSTASHMAAATVVEEIQRTWPNGDERAPGTFADCLREAVWEANRQIRARAAKDQGLQGMGTTFTGVGILQNTVICAQVGDSRAYLFRDGRLVQLTRDQSIVQEMLDAGTITAEEARVSDQRNLILQALGATPDLDVVLSHHELSGGDILLLCTDGLCGVLDDEYLAGALAETSGLRDACDALIRGANEAGGPDNITVLLAQVHENGEPVAGGGS